MKPIRTLAVSAALALLGSAVLAEGPHDGAIKARQALMGLFAFNIGQLGAMAQGDLPYDAGAANAAAGNLVALSSLNQSALWPEGSDNVAHTGTKALPAIWAADSDIMTNVTNLNAAAVAMQVAAGTDLAALQGGMAALGGACGACHKAFRAAE